MLIEPDTLPLKQVGQSGHPRPDPVRRTAAPVRTIRQTATREAMARRRRVVGETTGIRPVVFGPPGDEDPTLTAANRTGTSSGAHLAAGTPAWGRARRS